MPIIKSMSRKSVSFKQLTKYIHKEDKQLHAEIHRYISRVSASSAHSFTYLHNIHGVLPNDQSGIIEAFQKNDCYRRVRQNGNSVYHEILSFAKKDSGFLLENPITLKEFSRIYLELRAPNALSIARPHFDTDQIHLHFQISANELESSKSTRISKYEFRAIKRTIEQYQLEYFPELKFSYVQKRDKTYYQLFNKSKLTDAEYQIRKRGVKETLKEKLATTTASALNNSKSIPNLQETLKARDIDIYYRNGNPQGVIFKNKKYRFKFLLKSDQESLEKLKSFIPDKELEKSISRRLER